MWPRSNGEAIESCPQLHVAGAASSRTRGKSGVVSDM